MTTEDEEILFPMLIKWVASGDRRSFRVEYGYGICEVPWIKLDGGGGEVFSGTFPEFVEWVKQ